MPYLLLAVDTKTDRTIGHAVKANLERGLVLLLLLWVRRLRSLKDAH
jgi:hypothetical protein